MCRAPLALALALDLDGSSGLDCCSLLPLSVPQPAADRNRREDVFLPVKALLQAAGLPTPKSGSRLQQSKEASPALLAVFLRDLVVLEAADGLHPGRRDGFLESAGTAPFPVRSSGHQAVMHGVLMNVMQAGKITALEGKMGFAEILPQTRPPRRPLPTVELLGRQAVKLLHHRPKRFGVPRFFRAVADEMVVIRKHRPGLETPPEVVGKFQEALQEPVLHSVTRQQMPLVSRPGGHEVNPGRSESVRRSVRPVLSALGRFLIRWEWISHHHFFKRQGENGQASFWKFCPFPFILDGLSGLDCCSLLPLSVPQPAADGNRREDVFLPVKALLPAAGLPTPESGSKAAALQTVQS